MYPTAIRIDNIAANVGNIQLTNNAIEDRTYFIPAFSQPLVFNVGIFVSPGRDAYKSYISGNYWNAIEISTGVFGNIQGDISQALREKGFNAPSANPTAIDIVNYYTIPGYEIYRVRGASERRYVAYFPQPSSFIVDFISNGVDINGVFTANVPAPTLGANDYSLTITTGIYVYYRKIESPNYYDLLAGFSKDSRLIPPRIFSVNLAEDIEIGYYKINPLEPIPNLKSIDWVERKIKKGVSVSLDLTGCVLGTLVSNKIIPFPSTSGSQYPYTALLYSNVANLFAEWRALINNQITASELRLSTANNNVWSNNSSIQADVNYNSSHPLFAIDNQRAYDWHISPQVEGIGTLVMDSPRIIEIRAIVQENKVALAALGITLDAVKAKVDTLTPTDTSSLATSASIIDIKAELDALEISIDLLKVEIL
jgi:hypothetical protein